MPFRRHGFSPCCAFTTTRIFAGRRSTSPQGLTSLHPSRLPTGSLVSVTSAVGYRMSPKPRSFSRQGCSRGELLRFPSRIDALNLTFLLFKQPHALLIHVMTTIRVLNPTLRCFALGITAYPLPPTGLFNGEYQIRSLLGQGTRERPKLLQIVLYLDINLQVRSPARDFGRNQLILE